MKLKKIILLGLLISTGVLNAQTDFRPGYIIKDSGDTLYGEIDSRGDLLMSSICNFKGAGNTITKYYPNDITAYRFIDSKYYVSKEINNQKAFLEYLIKGKINLYYMRDDVGDHYYLDKEDVDLTEIQYEEGIKYIDDKQVFYKTTKHIGLLIYYMQDAPEFRKRIQKIKKPERKFLIKLAEDYHNAVCNGDKCIIYEKKQPLKINLEGVAGVVNFKNFENIVGNSYFQCGVIAHFWMPRVNEKIYLKTGYLFSKVEYTDDKYNQYIVVPVHIGYLAPKTYRIRPSFSIGLFSPSYSGGVYVRINKRINLGIQGLVNFKSKKVPWIPSQLSNYSFLGNLYIEF